MPKTRKNSKNIFKELDMIVAWLRQHLIYYAKIHGIYNHNTQSITHRIIDSRFTKNNNTSYTFMIQLSKMEI